MGPLRISHTTRTVAVNDHLDSGGDDSSNRETKTLEGRSTVSDRQGKANRGGRREGGGALCIISV